MPFYKNLILFLSSQLRAYKGVSPLISTVIMSLAITMVGVAFVQLVMVPKVKMLQVTTVLSKGVTKP